MSIGGRSFHLLSFSVSSFNVMTTGAEYWVSPVSCPLPCCLRHGVSLNWKLTHLARLAGLWALVSFLPLYSQHWRACMCHHLPRFSHGCRGFEHRLPCFTNRAVFPQQEVNLLYSKIPWAKGSISTLWRKSISKAEMVSTAASPWGMPFLGLMQIFSHLKALLDNWTF